jgi:acetyltransferase
VHLRFFGAIRTLSRDLIIRLTQIDYDRQMAFVLETGGEILGVARLSADPDNCRAEFAVTVRSDLKSHGMGTLLMRRLVEYAKRRGIEELVGEILAENARMISLARDLGFRLEVKAGAGGTLQATLPLREGRPATSDGQKA